MSIKTKFAVFLLFAIGFAGVSQAQVGDVDPSGESTCLQLRSANLRFQSRDANTNGEVSALQDFLNATGYLSDQPTGFFGLKTLAAVKKFQSANGFSPTGYVGPLTKAKIKAISCDANFGSTPNPTISAQSGSTQPSITLTSPSGAVTWTAGNTYNISWDYTNLSRTVSVYLTSFESNYDTITCLIGTVPVSNRNISFNFTSNYYCSNTASIYLKNGNYRIHLSADNGDPNDDLGTRNNASQGPTITLKGSVRGDLPTTSGSINIISPNGGETYQIGSNLPIRWSSNGPSTVVINLLKYSDSTHHDGGTTITANANASVGVYNWTIPSTITPGTMYKISIGIGGANDIGDGFFTISPAVTSQPSVTVTSPNGGENWQVGSRHDITWNYLGPSNTMVNIQLINGDGGAGWIANNVPASAQRLAWTVTTFNQQPSSYYRVVIRDTSNPNGILDDSNNEFTISATSTITPPPSAANQTYRLRVRFYDPNNSNTSTNGYNAVPVKVYRGDTSTSCNTLAFEATTNTSGYAWNDTMETGKYYKAVFTHGGAAYSSACVIVPVESTASDGLKISAVLGVPKADSTTPSQAVPPHSPPSTASCMGKYGAMYENANFTGTCVPINGDIPNLTNLNFNDKLSSYRIASGYKAYFFSDINYRGGNQIQSASGDKAYVGDSFNDIFSSVMITQSAATSSDCSETAMIRLYEHSNYSGTCLAVNSNTASLVNNNFNDKTSSIKVKSGFQAILFEHASYGGRSKAFTADATYIGDDFNDITSSITRIDPAITYGSTDKQSVIANVIETIKNILDAVSSGQIRASSAQTASIIDAAKNVLESAAILNSAE